MDKTLQKVIDSMTDEQRTAVYALIESIEEGVQHSDVNAEVLMHTVFEDAKRDGSLKDSFLEHAAQYGITNIGELFPEAKAVSDKPLFLNNKVEWVNKVLGKVNKLPFARVKMLFADITADTVRAKGYVKGSLKEEDVFGLLKRTTEPYTIYKKGKLDRDDIVDITSFEVVGWIKEAMKMKLDEEIARAILIGDGRLASDNDKIDETCIRPIFSDEDLYTIKKAIPAGNTNKAKAFIDTVIKARKDYRGSGSPSLFTTEDLVSDMLLLEDANGRKLYKDESDLKQVLRVSEIVTVNYMENLKRPATDSETNNHNVMGIIVNVSDYSVGSNRGGAVTMFDDFDIDYNQQKYLIETRLSGALTVPYSAIVVEEVTPVTPVTPGP